jgi:predicted dehydrogenase
MNNNRREFLKLSGLAGAGIITSTAASAISRMATSKINSLNLSGGYFNMHGYAAPKLETVRIAFIGVGSRGSAAVRRLNTIEGVSITVLCDISEKQVMAAKKGLDGSHNPALYLGKEDWKKVCERKDVDLIYTATPWALHTPIAVYAMEHGKHVATEVPAAKTVEECWQLVETSERTKKHCMMLENCCYDFFELLTLNMARQGFFGDIIHTEGAYIHDRSYKVFKGNLWRLGENVRKGNLYPTHGVGSIAQIMNLNCGDKMDYLVSVSSNDFTMGPMAKELAAKDRSYQQYATKTYRGNMNTSTIRTSKGRTIMLQHDVSSPRPYSRIHLVSGTKGVALKYPLPGRIATSHEGWLPEAEYQALEQKYTPAILNKMAEVAKQVGGHGGMDLLMDWRLIDCLRNGLPLDMTVYDAALWSSLGPLSEWSVAHRSNSIDVPDFTKGSWTTNKSTMDIDIKKGGDTKVNSAKAGGNVLQS